MDGASLEAGERARTETGSDGGARGSRLDIARPLDRDVTQVGLVLEQLIRQRYAAIDPQPGEPISRVSLHRADHVLCLVSNPLKHGTRHVPPVVSQREADERGAGVVSPMRRE